MFHIMARQVPFLHVYGTDGETGERACPHRANDASAYAVSSRDVTLAPCIRGRNPAWQGE